MKQRCLSVVLAVLLFGPSVVAYSLDSIKAPARGAQRPVHISEPVGMVMLGMGFLGLARQQRPRTVNAY